MTTALLDGDTFVFAAASAAEEVIQWDEDLWTLHANFDKARARLEASIAKAVEAVEADKFIVALSDKERFRPKVMPSYKSNRKGRKPIIYGPLREFCLESYDTYIRPELEGDDVLGILATHPKLVPGEKVIVAIDKDLKTIPGTLYNYGRDEWKKISEKDADYYFFSQVLTGDSTDGYPGCPGIGPKSAAKILDPFFESEDYGVESVWPAIVAAYEKAGLNEAVALQNARVARILRASDYNFKTKEVVLWTP